MGRRTKLSGGMTPVAGAAAVEPVQTRSILRAGGDVKLVLLTERPAGLGEGVPLTALSGV